MKKTFGDVHWDITEKLMDQISSQNRDTLILWAKEYAEENYLPVYEKYGKENLGEGLLISLKACMIELISVKAYKTILRDTRKAIQREKNPVALIALHSITTACAVINLPSNALGFLFYGCACKAYDELGTKAAEEDYQAYAQKEFAHAYASLLEHSVEDEKDPVNIQWNC